MAQLKHPTVPREYAGKWIAWNHSMTQIVGTGDSASDAKDAALKAGEKDPVLAKSPPADVHLIGARTR
jgi:hypothetical protein